jgi:hypothetical protein
MKTKSLKIISAIVIAFFALGTTGFAQGTDSRIGSIKQSQVEHGATQATAITKAEARKKVSAAARGQLSARDPKRARSVRRCR